MFSLRETFLSQKPLDLHQLFIMFVIIAEFWGNILHKAAEDIIKSPSRESNIYHQLFIKPLLQHNMIWQTNRSSPPCCCACCLRDHCWNTNSGADWCHKLSSCSEKQITYSIPKSTDWMWHFTKRWHVPIASRMHWGAEATLTSC